MGEGEDGRTPSLQCDKMFVPLGLAEVVSALAPVACVQPELVRCLRALLGRFPYVPWSVLWEGEMGIRGPGLGLELELGPSLEPKQEGDGEMSMCLQGRNCSTDKGTGKGAVGVAGSGEPMAPPPLQDSGKRRKLSFDVNGKDTGGGEGVERDEGCLSQGMKEDADIVMGGRDRSGRGSVAPLVGAVSLIKKLEHQSGCLGESAVCQAIDVLLLGVRDAGIFFADLEGKATKTGVSTLRDGKGFEKMRWDTVLLQSAWITCSLRVLAPFFDWSNSRHLRPASGALSGTVEEEKRLMGHRKDTRHVGGVRLEGVTAIEGGEENGEGQEEGKEGEGGNLPEVMRYLYDAFEAAVHFTCRNRMTTKDTGNSGCSNSPPPDSPPLLWRLLVSCAGSLPFREVECGIESQAGSTRSRLFAAIRLLASTSLSIVLEPGSAILAGTLEADSSVISPSMGVCNDLNDLGVDKCCGIWAGAVGSPPNAIEELDSRVEVAWDPALSAFQARRMSGFITGSLASAMPFSAGSTFGMLNAKPERDVEAVAFPMLCFLLMGSVELMVTKHWQKGIHGQGEDLAPHGPAQRVFKTGIQEQERLVGASSVSDMFLKGLKHSNGIVRRCAIAALPLLL
ncbi:unnamed protein product, partial [Choristocarpus tenellus]